VTKVAQRVSCMTPWAMRQENTVMSAMELKTKTHPQVSDLPMNDL
jgi:hypothetical protein